jgi:hypothetical protein
VPGLFGRPRVALIDAPHAAGHKDKNAVEPARRSQISHPNGIVVRMSSRRE